MDRFHNTPVSVSLSYFSAWQHPSKLQQEKLPPLCPLQNSWTNSWGKCLGTMQESDQILKVSAAIETAAKKHRNVAKQWLGLNRWKCLGMCLLELGIRSKLHIEVKCISTIDHWSRKRYGSKWSIVLLIPNVSTICWNAQALLGFLFDKFCELFVCGA